MCTLPRHLGIARDSPLRHRCTGRDRGAPPEGQLPLTVGFLEIVSTQELVVTAVYTATSADGALTMDIETVKPIVRPQLPRRPDKD